MAVADDDLFPPYIPRDEERDILAAVAQVRESRSSQVILLYGAGGVGKTRLVRALAQRRAESETVAWLRPIDLDDQEYYLLTNLQAHVARELDRLDPVGEHFEEYFRYLAESVPSGEHVTADTILSHISLSRQVFLKCYGRFVGAARKTVVMVFDTVETVRGTNVFSTLAQWMHSLPATVFVLSGRPASEDGTGCAEDPITAELGGQYRPMRVKTLPLGAFDEAAAGQYLHVSGIAAGITDDQREKIILLTRGHPLWLSLAVSYLNDVGVPPEASEEIEVETLRRDIPFRGPVPAAGAKREEDFKRRLMSPYRDADFWREAVKRLSAVRLGVNEAMWRDLMRDRPLPPDAASLTDAWRQLVKVPWIRPRANGSAVTVHDAMAEELAKRVIPLQDQSHKWRKEMWARAVANCDKQIAELEGRYAEDARKLDSRRQLTAEGRAPGRGSDFPVLSPGPIVEEAARLDTVKRAIDQLKVQRFYYRLLSDFESGSRHFLDLFRQAKRDQDLLFQELLATVMRRCLAAGDIPGGFEDVDSGALEAFGDWLATGHQPQHREISIALADYLITSGQSVAAIDVLKRLPLEGADARQLSRQKILFGNAYLRVPGEVKDGLPYLQEALTVAKDEIQTVERNQFIATAYKELGFYYRSVGRWREADDAYEHAWNAILLVRATERSDESRAELASIQTNWAYVKGLLGNYADALGLIESAIVMRGELGLRLEQGASHSVHGEVLRYQQKFKHAWAAYAKAERIFQELHESSWLGTVYQEQAICLYQAYLEGSRLLDGEDQLAAARDLAEQAVEICRQRSLRNYPSALNRAGRIVGHTDKDGGLELFAEGIRQGRAMSDGWFWMANIVDHAELCYRALLDTHNPNYRRKITEYEDELKAATAEYDFPDLRGRMELVEAHLAVLDWAGTGDDKLLDTALLNYSNGFRRIAERGYVGSAGIYVIPAAFTTFSGILKSLPRSIQSQWLDILRAAWTDSKPGSLMLLPRLEEL
jgi:tetratricopeptide (TPR) repeat protein